MSILEKKKIRKLNVYYNQDSHKFYEFDSNQELEVIYESNKKQILEGITHIEKDNILYACPNPRNIKFYFLPAMQEDLFLFLMQHKYR